MAWSGPHQNTNFPPWDFFDPSQANSAPGAGVDHAATAGPFGPGFPFGPGGFNAWTGGAPQRGWGWGGRGRRGGPWGEGHRHGGRRGRHHRHDNEGAEESQPEGDEQPPNYYDDGELVEKDDGEDTPMLSETEVDEKGTKKSNREKDNSPSTMRAEDTPAGDHPDPPESVPLPGQHGPHGPFPFRGRHGFHGRGGCARRGGPGMRGHHHGPHGPFGHHPHGPPPPFGPHGHHGPRGGWAGFGPMMAAFANHPFAQQLREYLNRANPSGAARGADADDGIETFAPPVDTFRAPAPQAGWVLHVALPGARKEDVGVHWDPERGALSISGVVYRPGDEAFLQGLVNGERKVGVFRREVRLPPTEAEAGRETELLVDSEGISARMEDGVLVVTVPVVEREWTEVRKVDIQ